MLSKLIILLYLLILLMLTIQGMHRFWLLILFKIHQRKKWKPAPLADPLPLVTIQLPLYNERHVVKRLIKNVIKIDYPKEKLSIQILDDSDDETTEICNKLVKKYSADGYDITLLHRHNREGFKAGALFNGLKSAKGELIAIFDADFIPPKSFLLDSVGYFQKKDVGMVQHRWEYVNDNLSFLTKLIANTLDGHFVIEQSARNLSGLFSNFCGSAGIWRKTAIKEAGGWQNDTLTEDLDLSYRAQMINWKFVYLQNKTVKCELPADIGDYKTQQYRMVKGSMETFKKLSSRLLFSPISFKAKIESLFHLKSNFSYILLFILALLTFPVMVIRIHYGQNLLSYIDFGFFLLASMGMTLFDLSSQKVLKKSLISQIVRMPFLAGLKIGISFSNAKAVMGGLFKSKGIFVRTPKYKAENQNGSYWKNKVYGNDVNFRDVLVEIFMAVYCLQALIFACSNKLYFSIPLLLFFVFGFSFIAVLQLFHSNLRRKALLISPVKKP